MVYIRFLAKPVSGLVMLLLLCVLIGGLVLDQISHLKHERAWVTHTYIVINTIDEVILKLTEAESSQRRFMLGQDEAALIPFRIATGQASDGTPADTVQGKIENFGR